MKSSNLLFVLIFLCLSISTKAQKSCKDLVKELENLTEQGQYDALGPISLRTLRTCAQEAGPSSSLFVRALIGRSGHLIHQQAYPKALDTILLAESLCRQYPDSLQNYLGACLSNKAMIYFYLQQFEPAILAIDSAIALAEVFPGKDSLDYGNGLSSKAIFLMTQGQFPEGIQLLQEAISNAEAARGKQSFHYLTRINNLGTILLQLGQVDAALQYFNEAEQTASEFSFSNESFYFTLYINLGLANIEKGKSLTGGQSAYFQKAREYLETAKELNLPSDRKEWILLYGNLGYLDLTEGKNESAELYLSRSVRTADSLRYWDINYPLIKNNLGTAFFQQGKWAEAIGTWEAAENKVMELLPGYPDNSYLLVILNNLANTHYHLGYYEQALQLMDRVIPMTNTVLGEAHPNYLLAKVNRANIWKDIGPAHWDKALKELEELIKNRAKTDLYPYEDGQIYLTAGGLYFYTGEFEKARERLAKGLALMRGTSAEHFTEYAIGLDAMGLTLQDLGDLEGAEQYFLEAIKWTEEHAQPWNPDNAPIFANYAYLKEVSGEIRSADSLFQRGADLVAQQINVNFSLSGGAGRIAFARSIASDYDYYRSFLYRHRDKLPRVGYRLLEDEWLLKGLLLNTDKKIQSALRNLQGPQLLELYLEIKRLKEQWKYEHSLPLETRMLKEQAQLDSLKWEFERKEAQLIRDAKVFRELSQTVSFEEIRDSLRQDEVAVEFIHFHYWDSLWTDETFYVAVVINPELNHPQVVELFEEKELTTLLAAHKNTPEDLQIKYSTQPRSGVSLYDLIWKPLIPYLKKTRRVFFAPSEHLYSLNFAAIAISEDSTLLDRYDLVQLPSTREVINRRKDELYKRDIKNAVLMGGFIYETIPDKMDRGRTSAKKVWDKFQRGDKDIPLEECTPKPQPSPQPGDRGGLDTLHHSLQEVNCIGHLLTDHGIPALVLTRYEGLEDVLNWMDQPTGVSPGILHIGTHSIYLRKTTGYATPYTLTDDPFYRSMIFFSGADDAWQNGQALASFEDGVLIPYELMDLNLLDTKLIVFSSCESGLGAIQDKEGPYGLQLAAKIAGARHVLASLWKVDDALSRAFMQAFYGFWIGENMEMQDAYLATQRFMKAKYPTSPFHWAGFVLM